MVGDMASKGFDEAGFAATLQAVGVMAEAFKDHLKPQAWSLGRLADDSARFTGELAPDCGLYNVHGWVMLDYLELMAYFRPEQRGEVAAWFERQAAIIRAGDFQDYDARGLCPRCLDAYGADGPDDPVVCGTCGLPASLGDGS